MIMQTLQYDLAHWRQVAHIVPDVEFDSIENVKSQWIDGLLLTKLEGNMKVRKAGHL